MERLTLTKENIEECAHRAAVVLHEGGVVLYPTDTLYGLAADALSDEAVRKIQRIKGRDEGKPIYAIVASLEMVSEYAEIPDDARLLAENFWPGSLTIIFKKKPGVISGIARDIHTFGARASSNPFCLALAREFGKPYTGTSANTAGEKPQRSVEAILAQLSRENHSSILQNTRMFEIDLIIDAGELPKSLPSTVVDVSTKKPVILREGAIPVADIWDVLKVKL